MGWVITWGGTRYPADDFTLDDLGRCEKESGTPWSLMNPLREARVAKAFLGVVLDRAGVPDGEPRDAYLDRLTLRQVRDIFTYDSDDEDPAGTEVREGSPLGRPAPSSSSSSPGESAGSGGSRRRHAGSVSATSSAS
jgi:hypothetical protein